MPDHVPLIARESQEFEAATQLVMVSYYSLGLERIADVRQQQLDGNPLSSLKFGRKYRRDTALADIERTAGNAAGQTRTQYGDVHRDSDRITGNAAASPAEA
jgi:hypothetical protein